MFSEPESGPDPWVIEAGTLDDPSGLKLSAILWTSAAQPWAHRGPSLPKFEKQPGED